MAAPIFTALLSTHRTIVCSSEAPGHQRRSGHGRTRLGANPEDDDGDGVADDDDRCAELPDTDLDLCPEPDAESEAPPDSGAALELTDEGSPAGCQLGAGPSTGSTGWLALGLIVGPWLRRRVRPAAAPNRSAPARRESVVS